MGAVSRSTHTRRTLVRVSALLLGTVSAVLASSPAMALMRDDGDQPGSGLSVLQTLGLFVGIPAGIVALIVFCVYIPEIVAGASVRPGVAVPSEPLWINGPPGAELPGEVPASEGPEPGQPSAGVAAAPTAARPAGPTTGGASARW